MKKRLISTLILIAYTAVLIKVMVFKVVPVIRAGQVTLDFGGANGGHPANFVPFSTIVAYLLGSNGLTIGFLNLAGNIALLVPMGFLAPLVYPHMTWKKALSLGAAAGLAIETMQTALNVGIFDIDDVILNTLGVMFGYFAFLLLSKWIHERKYAHLFIAVLFGIAATAGAFYIMYPHGYGPIVSDAGAGSRLGPLDENQEGPAPQTGDLCGGTGGTGQIVSKGDGTITIKSKRGTSEVIIITSRTDIRNSTGVISESGLNIGDHVTVVIMGENKTATTVLVCSSTS